MRILVLLTLLMVFSSPIQAGEETMIDGVLHVKNSAESKEGLQTPELTELWRAGGEDEEVFFGLITQVKIGPNGNIYLLDTQLHNVQVFSAEGEDLGTLSKEGEGPGEVRTPIDLAFMPDGSLGVAMPFPGKIVKVDLDDTPAGEFVPGADSAVEGNFLALSGCETLGDDIIAICTKISQSDTGQERLHFFAQYDAAGVEKTRFFEMLEILDFSNLKIDEFANYFPDNRRWALDASGRLFVAQSRNKYEITVYNIDGTVDRVIERESVPWQRDAQDQEIIDNAEEAIRGRVPIEIELKFDPCEPTIANMFVADDGSLWVLTSRAQRQSPEGIAVTYDVFDPTGHFIKQVALACDGNGRKDGFFHAGSDRMIQIVGFIDAALSMQGIAATEEGEEAKPMEVIVYEI